VETIAAKKKNRLALEHIGDYLHSISGALGDFQVSFFSAIPGFFRKFQVFPQFAQCQPVDRYFYTAPSKGLLFSSLSLDAIR
jgi:hypothetical protein